MTKHKNVFKVKNRLFGISLSGLAMVVGLLAPLMLLVQPAEAAACATPSPSYGTDSIPITVPSATTYAIWTRIKPAASTSNEVLLQVTNNATKSSTCYTVGGSSSLPVNAWTWVDYQNGNTSSIIQPSLSSGAYTLEYLGNEGGVGVDRVELINGGSCVPNGTGSNCPGTTTTTTTPPPTTTTTPPTTGSSGTSTSKTTTTSSGSKVSTAPGTSTDVTSAANSGTMANPLPLVDGDVVQDNSTPITVQPTIVNVASVNEVEYYLNNKLVYTAKKAPYSYKVNTGNLLNGRYKLTSKTVYDSGKIVSQTETLVVKHSALAEFWLVFKKYLITPLILIIILGAAFILWRRNRTPPVTTESAFDPDTLVSLPPQPSAEQLPPAPAEAPPPPTPQPSEPPANEPQPPEPSEPHDKSKYPW